MFIKNMLILCIFLLFCDCLVGKCRRVKRVIGGSEVECGRQPNVASLRNSSSLEHKCGATIISPHFALTAAHCVQYSEEEYILHLKNICAKQDGTIYEATVIKIIRHEAYDPLTRAHDLAVLRFASFENLRLLKPILPTAFFGLSGECKIYGYGYRDFRTKEVSDILLEGTLRIVSLDECERKLGPYVAPKNTDGMICAVGNNVDACQGDSGSPLICAGVIEGISSYGMSCAVPGIPGVYTSLAAHMRWISAVIEDDEWNC